MTIGRLAATQAARWAAVAWGNANSMATSAPRSAAAGSPEEVVEPFTAAPDDSSTAATTARPMRPETPKIATCSSRALIAFASAADRLEEALHAIQPGMLPRAVIASARMHRFLQLAQQAFLLVGEIHRRLDDDAAEQVAPRTAAHGLHALLAQPEHTSGLRLVRHFQLDVAAERRNFDGPTERRRGEAHRHLAREVATVALENCVLAHADLDVEISRRPTVASGLAFAGKADAIAVVDA